MTKSSDNLFAGLPKAIAGADAGANDGQATETTATADAEAAATEPVAEVAVVTKAAVVPVPDVEPVVKITELDMLKSRARLMGLQFSNNISLETLKTKVQAKLDGEDAEAAAQAAVAADEPEAEPTASTDDIDYSFATPKQKAALRQKMFAEQMRLIRVRITNLNPAKKDLPGEIFTVANKVLGSVKKYIPYGEVTDNGYHIPFWIYSQLKEREFVNIRSKKDSRGRTSIETSMAREFALEILPPLTEVELARLASAQAAQAGME